MIGRFLMAHIRPLPAEQKGRVSAPIERQLAVLLIAYERRRPIPRKRWTYAMEAARGMARGVISMKGR